MSAKYQFLTLGNFLAYREDLGVQVPIGHPYEDTSTTLDEARKTLREQFDHHIRQGHKDVRFHGVRYKATVYEIFA